MRSFPSRYTALHQAPINRRFFLKIGTYLGGGLILAGMPLSFFGATQRLTRVSSNPFTLGVASGDPTPDLNCLMDSPGPESPLGAADVSGSVLEIDYELSDSENFNNILRSGSVAAPELLGYSAHADVRGLEPGREYFYRWHAGGTTSPVGRTKTATLAHMEIRSVQVCLRFLPTI